MKFSIDRSVYNGILNKVKRNLLVTNDDNPLKYIYHDLTEKGLKIIAANYKSKSEFFIPIGEYINIEKIGSACISGSKLVELVSIFPEGKIVIEVSSEKEKQRASIFILGSKKTKYSIGCSEISLYPMNDFEIDEELKRNATISPRIFKEIIKNTEFATSKNDDMDISLMHIALEVNDAGIEACGASFEKISFIDIKKSTESFLSGNGTFYIMNIAIKEFFQHLDDANNIEIITDDKVLIIKQNNFSYNFRMVNVNFPNWKIKKNNKFDHSIIFNKEEVINCLKRVLIISPATMISIKNDSLEFNSVDIENNYSYGSGKEIISCKTDQENSFIVVTQLFLDVLTRNINEEVELFYNSDKNTSLKIEISEKTSVVFSTLRIE